MNKCRKLKVGLIFDYDHDYSEVSVVVTKVKPTRREPFKTEMLGDDDLAKGRPQGGAFPLSGHQKLLRLNFEF